MGEGCDECTLRRTIRTGGAISRTFIFTDTAALYTTRDARHCCSSSSPECNPGKHRSPSGQL